jgi:hypothetical protein
VHVSSRVVGFKKIKFYTNENVGSWRARPAGAEITTSYWLSVPRSTMQALPYSKDDKRDGIVGMGFAMKNVATLLLMCDVRDVGLAFGQGDDAEGETKPVGGRTAIPESLGDEPRIYLYDAFPGGIGFSAPLHGMHGELLERTRELIAGCECDHGCPTCVGPIGETGPLAKTVALAIQHMLATGQIADAGRGDSSHRPCRRGGAASAEADVPSDGDEAVARRSVAQQWSGRRPCHGASRRSSRGGAAASRRRGDPWRRPRMAVLRAQRAAEVLGGCQARRGAKGLCIGRSPLRRRHAAWPPSHRRRRRHAAPGRRRTERAQARWPRPRERLLGDAPPPGLDGVCVIDLETTGLAGGAGTQAFLVAARASTATPSWCGSSSRRFEHERATGDARRLDVRSHTSHHVQRPHLRPAALLEMRFSFNRLAWPWPRSAASRMRCIRPAASGASAAPSPASR